MNDAQNRLITTLLAIEWISLMAVMFGGEALLRLSHGDMNEHTERYFKVGHAHAGILVSVGMILLLVISRTDLGTQGILLTWASWLVGVLLLSGGFFYHAYLGESGKLSVGTTMTAIGGVLIFLVGLWMAVQLLRAR